MGRLLAYSASLLLLVAACDSEPPTLASINLSLDESAEGGCPVDATCRDFRMSCGAKVLLRLTDVSTGEVLQDADGRPISVCLDADANPDICSLADLAPQMVLGGMPAKTLRVEVAVWDADADGSDLDKDGCPDTLAFDLLGRPLPTVDPAPAFAGAAYFRAGIESDVTVPVACSAPALLDADTCAANLPTDVKAVVTDMGTMQSLRTEQADGVSVQAGVARPLIDNEGGTFYVLEKDQDSLSLLLDNDGATPIYGDSILLPFVPGEDLVCSTTTEDIAQATTSVVCEEKDVTSDELSLGPLLLSKEILDAALDTLGLENFPDEGLLIGRVVDEGFSPVAGVAVTPDSGSVLYLSEDLASASQGLSTNSAYFVSTDVPYGAFWTASHFDGRRHSGNPRGGLIRGKLSTVVIRMTGDVIGE